MEIILVVLSAVIVAAVFDVIVDLIFEDEKPKLLKLLFPTFHGEKKRHSDRHW